MNIHSGHFIGNKYENKQNQSKNGCFNNPQIQIQVKYLFVILEIIEFKYLMVKMVNFYLNLVK